MSRASRGFRIAGRVIKYLALTVVFSVIALLLWRIASSGTPSELKTLIPNDKLVSAYEEYGNDLYIFDQDLKSITTAERNKGYFSITECEIIPEAEQIQVVFRYNNSTIRALATDYELEDIPSPDEYLYDVTLCVMTDLTPEDDSDNSGKIKESVSYTRITPSQQEHERKNLYNYYRYVFDFSGTGLSLSELLDSGELLAVFADVYYVEDTDYEEQAYGTLCIYEYKAQRVNARLSARDKAAIKEYKES